MALLAYLYGETIGRRTSIEYITRLELDPPKHPPPDSYEALAQGHLLPHLPRYDDVQRLEWSFRDLSRA